MSLTLLIGFASGLLAGVVLAVLDGRFAGRFAASAEASPAAARPSPVLLASLLLGTAVPFAVLSLHESPGPGAVYRGVVVAVLVWIATIDWRWRIIPNRLVYLATACALVASPIARPGPALLAYALALLGCFVAGGVFLLFFLLSLLIYRRAGAFGLGDVKLAAFVGAAVGFPAALSAVVLATVVGAILALAWALASGSRKTGFPYGPAIAAGAILAMLIAPTGGIF
ncbi:MAG: prepilin peptidase [Chloroflexota bacterium]